MKAFALFCIVLSASLTANAASDCTSIHGRAHYYCGDGNLRIWQIGTHHEYEPDSTSISRVAHWLEAGTSESERKRYACPAGQVDLYADFLICPTEPYKTGSVQHAIVKSAVQRHYTHEPDN